MSLELEEFGPDAAHCAILVVDVVDFSRRTDPVRLQLRHALYSMLSSALHQSRISDNAYDFEDRGDSVLALFKPSVPKNRLLADFDQNLLRLLHDHNVGRDDRLRLRVAIHAGEVIRDEHGFFGSDVTLTTRLLDSSAMAAAAQLTDADRTLAVSDAIYHSVVESGVPGIDPSEYRLVIAEIKGARVPMWTSLAPVPPPVQPPPGGREDGLDSGDLHHRSIFLVDIEDSDSRPDHIKKLHRDALRRMMTGAITDADVARGQSDPFFDTGDGLRVMFTPETPKNRLAGPLISALASRLAAYNAAAPVGAHMRLRAVLAAGELRRDRYDYFGSQLNEACWLLNSDELRCCLRATTAPMAFMVSAEIYHGVVRHGYPQIDPVGFQKCIVTHKDRDFSTWVSFPS